MSRERAITTVICAVLLVACESGAYGVEVTFSREATRDEARVIELALVEGGCSGIAEATSPVDAVQRRVLRRAGSRSSFDTAPPGRYGVHALARDAGCAVIADGCAEAELVAGGSGTIRLVLDDTNGAGCAGCDDGVCGAALDGGTLDASTPDAGVPDATVLDGGTDGAAPDASMPDAGPPDGGPSTLCPLAPAAIFCDGFESATPAAPSPWSTTYVSAGSTLSVVDGPARFGARAMRSYVSVPREEATFSYTLAPAIDSGELWVRFYVLVEPGFDVEGLAIAYLQGGTQDGIALQLRAGGQLDLWFGTDPRGVLVGSGATVPTGTWACVEMHITLGDTGGGVSLFVDADAAGSHGPRDTLPDGGFRELMVGIENTHDTQEPATVFIDEVALSRTRPGC